MVDVVNTELNLTHFYTTLDFYWIFVKILPIWIRKNVEVLKNIGEVMGEKIIWALRTQYMATWIYGQKHQKYDVIKIRTYTLS